ncbi:MAG: RidA family protein [Azospirillum sp.]|nr:RidA family protein [Azospirillum sp.]MCA3266508.1 RidA family protein [Azospirillum sp.]
MKRHNPSELSPPFARYAHAVEVETPGRLLFASGQLGLAKDGTVPADCAGQCAVIFRHLDAILASAGMGRGNVVRVNAFVTSREEMAPYMAARDAWFAEAPPPASTLVIVSGFTRPEFKVEIEIVASRPL